MTSLFVAPTFPGVARRRPDSSSTLFRRHRAGEHAAAGRACGVPAPNPPHLHRHRSSRRSPAPLNSMSNNASAASSSSSNVSAVNTPPASSASVPEEYVRLAEELVDVAGEVVLSYFRDGALSVDLKGDASPVTAADRAAETAMRELLQRRVPTHAVLGEEFGGSGGVETRVAPDTTLEDARAAVPEWTWVLDPIDGTKAFIAGKPTFGTLVALLHHGAPVLGVIHQPFTCERWVGVTNGATRYNGRIVRCQGGDGGGGEGRSRRHGGAAAPPLGDDVATDGDVLKRAVLHCTHPDMFTEGLDRVSFEDLSARCRFTIFSADCYAYALLVSGGVSLVCEADMKPWDYMALVPIITAAGGVITDWQGRPLSLYSDGRVLAGASAALHARALEMLNAPPRGVLWLQQKDERAGSGVPTEQGVADRLPDAPPSIIGARSMTGVGHGSATGGGIDVNVEIKTLNTRYLEVSAKLPRSVSAYEEEITALLRDELMRGKVIVAVDVKGTTMSVLPLRVDTDAVQAARILLDQLRAAAGIQKELSLDDVLRFSEVLTKDDSIADEVENSRLLKELVFVALRAAIEDLQRMRHREGYNLQLDLLRRAACIRDAATDVELRAPSRVVAERERLQRNLAELHRRLSGFDGRSSTASAELELAEQMRLDQEIILFVHRVDVSEEIVRLKSHLRLFETCFFTTRPIGKKLNFVLQELHREANTIANKANDAAVSQLCVIMKDEIEKAREQVQNIV